MTSKLFAFKAGSEVPSQLTSRINNIFCASQLGKYEVTYKTYRREQARLNILQFHDDTKLYVLSDAIYVVDSEFEIILTKADLWKLRQTIKVQGASYEIDRFQHGKVEKCLIRVGIATQGPLTRALLVELGEMGDQLIHELISPFPISLDMQRFEGMKAAAYFEMFNKI